MNITNKENAVTTATFKKNKDEYTILCKESNSDVENRTDYNEEMIIEQCTLIPDDKTIILERSVNFIVFKLIVAMTKALHHAIFPDVKGKWMFTRLQTDRLIAADEQYNKIQIVHTHNFNHKLTKNEIYIDDKKVGNIYFSLM